MATLTIRPNGDNDINIQIVLPADTIHYVAVDDTDGHDSDATRVVNTAGTTVYDDYDAEDHTAETGTINHVTVYGVLKATGAGGTYRLRCNGTYLNDATALGTDYVEYSVELADIPGGSGWTWTQIDAMTIGVEIYSPSKVSASCTQMYAVVDYTPSAGGLTIPIAIQHYKLMREK